VNDIIVVAEIFLTVHRRHELVFQADFGLGFDPDLRLGRHFGWCSGSPYRESAYGSIYSWRFEVETLTLRLGFFCCLKLMSWRNLKVKDSNDGIVSLELVQILPGLELAQGESSGGHDGYWNLFAPRSGANKAKGTSSFTGANGSSRGLHGVT
jgi:hypothetical protein